MTLQYHPATAEGRLVDVRGSSSTRWVFADEIDVLWIKPTTGGWQGWSDDLGHLCMASGKGDMVGVLGGRAPGYGLGRWGWTVDGPSGGISIDDRGLPSAEGKESREGWHR